MSLIKELLDRSWETPGLIEDVGPGGGVPATPAAKIGLGFFLAVVTTLFSLFCVAYIMRMEYPDWQALPDPGLLWLNTIVLILSSIAMQRTKRAALLGEVKGVRFSLITSGVLSFAFLAGQFAAWQQLSAAGYFAASNPANAFFYLITGLHGLQTYLGQHRQDEFLENLCRKLLSYALGRSLILSDDLLVRDMRTTLEADNNRFGSLIVRIVTSPQFLNRRGGGQSERK